MKTLVADPSLDRQIVQEIVPKDLCTCLVCPVAA
jgi:hypothetical protein